MIFVFYLLFTFFIHASPVFDAFKQKGYIELLNQQQGANFFDQLYSSFDAFIEYVATHTPARKNLSFSKGQFWKTELGQFYATSFVGYGDDSKIPSRKLHYFYYSTDYHDFLIDQYPDLLQSSTEIAQFLNLCRDLATSSTGTFASMVDELAVGPLFDSEINRLPVLLKIVKYLPASWTVPHFDASAFSLFLDSTDEESLVFAPYQETIAASDFYVPPRQYRRLPSRSSSILIPGMFLQSQEPSLVPTPHAALRKDTIRHSVIAFCVVPFKQPATANLPAMPKL